VFSIQLTKEVILLCVIRIKKNKLLKLIKTLVNDSINNVLHKKLSESDKLKNVSDVFTNAHEVDNKFKTIFKAYTNYYVGTIIEDKYCSKELKEYLDCIQALMNNFKQNDLDKYFE
jgi:hypothetical protein